MSVSTKFGDQFASLKTGWARTVHKVKIKAGQVEQTKQEEYERESKRVHELYLKYKKVSQMLEKYLTHMKVLAAEQSTLYESLSDLCETAGISGNAPLNKIRMLTTEMDENRVDLESKMRLYMVNPLTEYCYQFTDMQARMTELEKRRLDKDRYSYEYSRLLDNPKSDKLKVEKVFEKMNRANAEYDALLAELMTDMPNVFQDQASFLNPVLAAYVKTMAIYLKTLSAAAGEATESISNIDESSSLNHKRISTLPKDSAYRPPDPVPRKLSFLTQPNPIATQPNMTTTTAPVVAPPVFAPLPPERTEPAANPFTATNTVQHPVISLAKTDITPTPIVATAPIVITAPPVSEIEDIPLNANQRAIAVFDFMADNDEELPFVKNDVLNVLEKDDATGWWTCELRGNTGLCPSNYLKVIT